jgi:hypothetical protein
MQPLVKEGWFPSQEEIVKLSLRKFLDSHDPRMMAQFIQEDVEWGLRGTQ